MTPFDFRLLLDLAERLLTDDSDEAIVRTVINRIYYAAFNVAREVVAQDEQVSNHRVHDRVWRWYVDHDAGLPMERLGHIGFRLSRMRRQADYDATATLTVRDARRALRAARRLIESISEIH